MNDKGQPYESQFLVHASFLQYYLETSGEYDPSQGDFSNDGIIAPIDDSGVRVSCGTQVGDVRITFRVVASPDDWQRGSGVAAECDLVLPDGKFYITSITTDDGYEYDFGRPLRCRILVQVSGRDEAQYDDGDNMLEHHIITIAPVLDEQPRWRSAAIDDVGRGFEEVAAHVEKP
jgi:hypothetical protein